MNRRNSRTRSTCHRCRRENPSPEWALEGPSAAYRAEFDAVLDSIRIDGGSTSCDDMAHSFRRVGHTVT